jgi:2,4-dienoyl-CoA reductase-like NADH-dependent reductase (Old Yellow Enzyme family)
MRNRFWQTSHCTGFGSERPGTQARFRGLKAEGGWAVVCTEFCSIHPESDEYPWHSARLWDEGDVINLRAMCDEVHRHGALAGVQLWYNGMHSPALESREVARGPSGLPSNVFPERSVYDAIADDDDIAAIINMYVLAAQRAEQAGFDIVELSGADSTLPMQFLERRYNRRNDGYGGSLANRARFYIEVMSALKRAVGDRLAPCARHIARAERSTLCGTEGPTERMAAERCSRRLPDRRLSCAATRIERDIRWPSIGAGIRIPESAISPAVHPGATSVGPRDIPQAWRLTTEGRDRLTRFKEAFQIRHHPPAEIAPDSL